MKITSFGSKLILSYLLVILIPFTLIAFFLDKKLEKNSLHNIQSSLITRARLIEDRLFSDKLAGEDTAYLESVVKKLSLMAECRITVISVSGKVLADSEKPLEDIARMENHSDRPEVKTALAGRVGVDIRYSPTLKIDMLYAALPLQNKNVIAGALRLALPLTSVQNTLFVIRKIVFLGLFFAVIFAFILGSVLALKTVGPINKMIQVSRRFSEGDFSRRIFHGSRDEIGELASTLNHMAQDIENKVKEIESQNQKLAAIFNSMVEGIMVIDGLARIVSINPAAERIFAVSGSAVKGRLFLEAIRNNDLFGIIDITLRSGESSRAEITLLYPVKRIFEINAAPIFDVPVSSGGNADIVVGCLAVIHDITEIRRLETMRRDFVANVSHELKTPLTSIKGFVETLLEGALDDKENGRNFLKIVQEHTERLDSLVSDLLVLSSLESKETPLNKENVDLRQQSDKVILGFSSQLKDKNIKVENNIRPGLVVNVDKKKIEQVFTNLIDNAIKFNKGNGFIKIYNNDMSGFTKITVEDSGLGIPEKDISRIFERFYRVDKARSRELGGTGLGLSIVKHIIELHDGTVGVESAEGVGSKFWFTMP
ncbi:MAG: ATP-binding protein [Candidatus Omnitrophica bacterium]|nr:ATP-binding protein [Candidatus Omnitrophota bacterium]